MACALGFVQRSSGVVLGPALVAFVVLLAAVAPVASSDGPDASAAVAGECSVSAGQGGGAHGPGRNECPALAEAEGPVDEIDPREHGPRTVPAEERVDRHHCRCGGRSPADAAVVQAVLAANAADLSRLCRRLI